MVQELEVLSSKLQRVSMWTRTSVLVLGVPDFSHFLSLEFFLDDVTSSDLFV